MDNGFNQSDYLVRRRFWQFIGATIYVEQLDSQPVMQAKLKAFKLREDIRFYRDESMNLELLRISARQIIDFAATYDVFDSLSNQPVGAIKRKGMRSLLRDEWQILDVDGNQIALVKEDSLILGLVRRFLTNLVPQKFHILSNDETQTLGTIKQNFNPFTVKLTTHFEPALTEVMNPKLALAMVVMLASIEGRQG